MDTWIVDALSSISIVAGSFVLAGFVIDIFAGPLAKDKVVHWFENQDLERSLRSWGEFFASATDKIFGGNHLALRCVLLSSLISIALLWLLGLSLFPQSDNYLVDVLGMHPHLFILGFIVVNSTADYVSLFQTRMYALGLGSATSKSEAARILVSDVVVTAGIYFAAYFFVACSLYLALLGGTFLEDNAVDLFASAPSKFLVLMLLIWPIATRLSAADFVAPPWLVSPISAALLTTSHFLSDTGRIPDILLLLEIIEVLILALSIGLVLSASARQRSLPRSVLKAALLMTLALYMFEDSVLESEVGYLLDIEVFGWLAAIALLLLNVGVVAIWRCARVSWEWPVFFLLATALLVQIVYYEALEFDSDAATTGAYAMALVLWYGPIISALMYFARGSIIDKLASRATRIVGTVFATGGVIAVVFALYASLSEARFADMDLDAQRRFDATAEYSRLALFASFATTFWTSGLLWLSGIGLFVRRRARFLKGMPKLLGKLFAVHERPFAITLFLGALPVLLFDVMAGLIRATIR